MELKPVERRSISDDVFRQLAHAIVGGRLAAGAALPSERELCARLDVNRGAVREGVKRLEQAGLVVSRHGSRNEVLDYRSTAGLDLLVHLVESLDGDLQLDLTRSIMEMRSAIAPEAARLCARRSPDRAPALDALVASMQAAGDDLVRLQALALRFWGEVVEGSQNLAFRLAMNSLRKVYEPAQDVLAPLLSGELHDLAGCRRLAKAIRAGNEAGAAQAARSILRRGLDAVTVTIEALRAGTAGGGASG